MKLNFSIFALVALSFKPVAAANFESEGREEHHRGGGLRSGGSDSMEGRYKHGGGNKENNWYPKEKFAVKEEHSRHKNDERMSLGGKNLPDGAGCFVGGECASGRCEAKSSWSVRRVCTPTLALGESCNEDNDCSSGVCHGGLFDKVCVECDSNDDCEGHGESLPGTLPKAFCYTGDAERGPYCSEWKNGNPIGSEGYPVWLGTEHDPPVMMPRHIIDGPAMSLVWHFDLNNQIGGEETSNGFTANATHIKIPMNTKLLAGYSMTNHMVDEHETGIVSLRFASNPASILSPYAIAGVAEKYHTLTHDGELDTSWVDQIREELEQRDAATEQQAEDVHVQRNYQMVAAASMAGVAETAVESNLDIVHLTEIREYVRRVQAGELSVTDLASSQFLVDGSKEAAEALVHARTLSSLKSQNHCSHFEEGEGVGMTATHLEFPLNTAVTWLKGITEFAPSHFFGLGAGVGVAHYDSNRHLLEFRVQFFQESRMYMGQAPLKPNGVYVGPILSHYPVRQEDGRSDQFYEPNIDFNFALNQAIKLTNSMPMDYSAFDRAPTCSEELEGKLDDLWLRAQQESETNQNLFANLLGQHAILKLAAESPVCGSNWIKADNYPHLVGYGPLEFLMYAHTIVEHDATVSKEACTSTWWDEWDAFYKQDA